MQIIHFPNKPCRKSLRSISYAKKFGLVFQGEKHILIKPKNRCGNRQVGKRWAIAGSAIWGLVQGLWAVVLRVCLVDAFVYHADPLTGVGRSNNRLFASLMLSFGACRHEC
jgi:hypothetical protein